MQRIDGYLTEVVYPHHFQREATPAWMTFAATALGRHSPDITRSYDWCELGCGQGFSLVINAAANPRGQFFGVDLNPRHIAHAHGLAQAAGLSNVTFVEGDLAAMDGAQAWPDSFDFIVCHGVYSWLSSAHQQALLRFVEQRLKPGGLVYLSYATQPGMAFFAAPQRLLRQFVEAAEGPLASRFEDAVAKLLRVSSGVTATELHAYVQRSLPLGAAYLMHDWLAADWSCLHVADVMADFERSGCEWLGSATLLENVDALSIPEYARQQLSELHGAPQRETFKDLVRHQSLRRDLYQKGGRAMDENEHRRALLAQEVSLLPQQPATIDQATFDTRIGPVTVDPELLTPIRAALAQGPLSFSALCGDQALRQRMPMMSPALQLLAWAGQLHPLLPGASDPAHCRRLNRVIAERALHGEGYTHLAAPRLGSAIAASLLEMAAARVLLEHPDLRGGALQETVLALLKRTGWQHESAGEEHWKLELGNFERVTLPIWLATGIVGA